MYTRAMGEYDAETQAFSAFAGTGGSSPYNPEANGRLKGIRVIVSGQAATSLTRGVLIRLTCSIWQPTNQVDFFVAGHGLETVPQQNPPVYDFPCDLPVQVGVKITMEGKCLEATHVTNSVLVMGMFD